MIGRVFTVWLWSRLLYFGVALALFFCVTSCVQTGPGGKESLMFFGTGQEVEFGRGMKEQVEKDNKLLADTSWQNYVSAVGEKIVAVSDRSDIDYHFAVIESDQVNAFALPGGYVYFYTGLLSRMESEAELAAVMSHEISHVVARHGMKRLQTALIAQMGYAVVFSGRQSSQVREAAIGAGLSLVFSGYSRSAEKEADNYGIQYMNKAGYDPQGAVDMFQVLAAAGSGQMNSYEKLTASHPDTQERIRLAQAQIAVLPNTGASRQMGREKYQKMKTRLPQPHTTGAAPKK